MNKTSILRKRFIPDEIIDISGDEILYRDEELLITRWKAIKPRHDISSGVSHAFLKEGFKISRFYDSNGDFLYWYCDIIDVDYNKETDTYMLVDLLVDLKQLPDGTLRVLDMDELAEALETGLISQEQACRALRKLDRLLQMVYRGEFPPQVCLDKLD